MQRGASGNSNRKESLGRAPVKSFYEVFRSLLPVNFVFVVVCFLLGVYTCHVSLKPKSTSKIIEITSFAILFALFLTSFLRAVFTPSGSIPNTDEWLYGVDDHGKPDTRLESKRSGDRRYCKWCDKYKPDRAHHCRVCKKCVLKMDHHCPWLHNCVGFRNHKYFLLVIIYSTILCILFSFSLLPRVIDIAHGKEDDNTRVIVYVSGMSFGVALSAGLVLFLSFHIWMMFNGLTTIEFCEKSNKKFRSQYNLGFGKNLTTNFGPKWYLWWLPCSPPTGDGCHFDVDLETLAFAPKIWREQKV